MLHRFIVTLISSVNSPYRIPLRNSSYPIPGLVSKELGFVALEVISTTNTDKTQKSEVIF